MEKERRSKLADYIASAIRFASKETGLEWPEETILVAKSYEELAELNEIIGMKIYIMNMPSAYSFFVAFPAENIGSALLQKAFLEYLDLYDLSDIYD